MRRPGVGTNGTARVTNSTDGIRQRQGHAPQCASNPCRAAIDVPIHSASKAFRLLLAVTLWWAIYSAISATQFIAMGEATGNPIAWSQALAYGFAGNMPWVPFTLFLFWLAWKYPIGRGHMLRNIAIHALGVAAIIVVKAAYICLTNPYLIWYDGVLPGFGEVVVTSIRNNLMTGWTVVGVGHAFVFYRRARERERELADMERTLVAARLDALRAQINPHFLFNALNSVAEMVHVDADQADEMLVSLSALLRDGLANEERQLRPLREEIALVEHYLLIEKIRLGQRLSVVWEVEAECLPEPVPVLILQPLVENAIVHAIARSKTAGTVTIRARNRESMLLLGVENSIGEGEHAAAGNGIGLRSVSGRLELLYGGQARLVRRESEAGSYVVELHVPLRAA